MKKPGKRGRKPAKIDLKAKLERSRQSARECRARKKLRYQYLEELVSSKERAICALREELEMVKNQSHTAQTRGGRTLDTSLVQHRLEAAAVVMVTKDELRSDSDRSDVSDEPLTV